MIAALAAAASAQEITDDMVGQDQRAWTMWSSGIRALEREKLDDSRKAFDQVVKLKLSELRLALMADRSGTLRFEQAVEAQRLGDAGKPLLDRIVKGREQRKLAEDGWHYAAIGRFEYAEANFKALIEAHPDPVALLELARYNPARTETLIKLVANADVGPSASQVLAMLQRGEQQLYTDPIEIEVHIERLAGPPRVVYEATNFLKASGEYAVPHLLAYLRNPKKRELEPAIVRLLPLLGRGGLNPLVVALGMSEPLTQQVIAQALGSIGYRQAAPYLARLASAEPSAPGEVRAAAAAALQQVLKGGTSDPAALFRELADDYFNDIESLRADVRFPTANVWYLDESGKELRYYSVPRDIFSPIMAMRSAEQALKLDSNNPDAIALWLAANFRREARLSLDVESETASELARKDATKPDEYPRAVYFARAAGPLYGHLVLRRAVRDRDAGVALGAIAALASTAGRESLVGPEDYKQALVQALEFPSRLVRIKAALAITRSLPRSAFEGSHNVVPVLAEALGQTGRPVALVVDPDPQTRNKAQAVLRAADYEVVSDARLFSAQEAARKRNVVGLDVIVLASDVQAPALEAAINELRGRVESSAAPILIVAKPRQTVMASRAARSHVGVESIPSDVFELGDPERVQKGFLDKLSDATRALGMKPLDRPTALGLALETADVLRMLAVSRSDVLDAARAEGALVRALSQSDERLRIRSASVLALIGKASAQRALARTALDPHNSKTQRISTYSSLAESARTLGNQLGPELVDKLVAETRDEQDLDLRTAASQALGALNLRTNNVSAIIRAQSRG